MVQYNKPLFYLLIAVLCWCAPYAFAAEDDDGVGGFYRRTLSGKYNLLEDDFADIRQRPTRFDYLNEEMEHNRLFARPDGPEFALVNVQWKDGAVFINDLQTFEGSSKQRRGFPTGRKPQFYFRLFSGTDDQPLLEEEFEIPQRLNYDLFDAVTGELSGGAVMRDDVDFVLRVPLTDKSANRLKFFKRAQRSFKLHDAAGAEDAGAVDQVVGETTF